MDTSMEQADIITDCLRAAQAAFFSSAHYSPPRFISPFSSRFHCLVFCPFTYPTVLDAAQQ